jgi:hypothetical protein
MNAGHFVIHMDAGDIKIYNNEKGVPHLNLKEVEEEVALSFVQTIRGNMEGFTKQEVEETRAAREAQAMGHGWAPRGPQLSGNGTCKHDS